MLKLSSFTRTFTCLARLGILPSHSNMASAPLTIDGIEIAGPEGAIGNSEEADKLFNKFEDFWKWGPHLTLYLRKELFCENVHDFVTAFKREADWAEFYRADIKDDASKQVPRGLRSRVAQAHQRTVKAPAQAADLKTKGAQATDFDTPLDSNDIKDMVKRFWLRHKLKIMLEQMPGDLLISRIFKELEKRFLHITDILKIKGVKWERRVHEGKKKVAEHLYTDANAADQDKDNLPATVQAYLQALEMYMLAMAIVGSKPLEPQPAQAETREADPSDYLLFPYDFSIQYCHRATTFANNALCAHSASTVFQMLKERDEEV